MPTSPRVVDCSKNLKLCDFDNNVLETIFNQNYTNRFKPQPVETVVFK